MRAPLTALLAPALALALGGCPLLDQRAFNPHAGDKPRVAVAPPKPLPPGPPPLVAIDFTTSAPAYEEELANAVRRALAVRPDVIFSVEVLVPVSGGPAAQADQARAGAETARRIAQTIVEAGADQGQIETAVRADPARRVEQALVRVR